MNADDWTHPLDALSKALPPGRAVLLDDRGLVESVVDFPRDPRLPQNQARAMRRELHGDWIRAGRERLGWTQQQLADRLGVGVMSISRWERGALPVSQSRVTELESLLGRWLAPVGHEDG